MLMRLNKFLCVLLFCLLSVLKLLAQDPLPACPVKGKLMQSVKPMKEMKLLMIQYKSGWICLLLLRK